MTDIQKQLFALSDETYKQFHIKLIPTIDPDTVIGVRIPAVRKLAGQLFGRADVSGFMQRLPHRYYEENNLHAFLIEQYRDFDECLAAVNAFLPYVDNWATCDSLRPKVFGKHTDELLLSVRRWMASGHLYSVRFGIEMLMCFYLDDAFDVSYLEMVAKVRSEEYYVRMMIAWYFATALAKQYEAALPYIEQGRLAVWTHNKAIQKAVESLRIKDEQKAYLRTLKVGNTKNRQ